MKTKTITEVSQTLNISTRMLRYYEKAGLIHSTKKEGYSYRVYDMDTYQKIQQIIILRKLRIPVKQIASILTHKDARHAITIFEDNVSKLNMDIDSLAKIRETLLYLITELETNTNLKIKTTILNDNKVLNALQTLSFSNNKIKENVTMSDLNQANQTLEKSLPVRILYLPPMYVASIQHTGENSETITAKKLEEFISQTNLFSIKPDSRHFGFNNPAHQEGKDASELGYERWLSIPEEMSVSAPFVKKKVLGGLYAAHAIKFGEFDHWPMLFHWITESEEYEVDFTTPRSEPSSLTADPAMEEHLNFFLNLQDPNFDITTMQLDLLFPIKKKEIQ